MTIKMTHEILSHYFPEMPLINGKYINAIDIPWLNKSSSITKFLKTNHSSDAENQSTSKLYKKYCKYRKSENHEFICSKKYFEYVMDKNEL